MGYAGADDRSTERLVVLAGASLWEGTRLADRHLAEHLTEYASVLYVEPPISRRGAARHDTRMTQPVVREVADALRVLSPVVLPAKDRLLVDRLTAWAMRKAIGRAVDEIGLPVAATICSAPHRDLFGSAGEARKIYWVKDDYVAGAHLLDLPVGRMRRAVARRAAEADDIVVVSPGLMRSFEEAGHSPIMVPNGVDVGRSRSPEALSPPEDIGLPRPIVGYIGGISDRIDPDVLAAVTERDLSVLLVGPLNRSATRNRLGPILDRPNVRWLGPRPFEALPPYLEAIDVGIVPYRTDVFNRASFPLKALEYLAAGRQVVTTDLPAMRWLDSEQVRVAADPGAFADSVQRALEVARDPDTEGACRLVASLHTWSDRAERFAQIIGLDHR